MTNPSLRDLGYVIGGKIRFVDDRPTDTRTLHTEEHLDFRPMLPFLLIDHRGSKPDTPDGGE